VHSPSNIPDLLVAATPAAAQALSLPASAVTIVDGQARTDSRDVATCFGKAHKNVLQAINSLHVSDEFRRLNFQPFKINDFTGESVSHVSMTRDAFTFLAMGFTGPKAGAFKEAFIARFNSMEDQLRSGSGRAGIGSVTRPPLVKEVAATFRAFHSIARTAGLDRNQASLSAARATKAETGVDPIERLGVTHLLAPQQEAALTPTQIGARLGGKSGIAVNRLLLARGFQTQVPEVKGSPSWHPTELGRPHAVWTDTGKQHGDGRPVRQLLWVASIIPFISGDAP
jgi:Rha family phage regulatory protein